MGKPGVKILGQRQREPTGERGRPGQSRTLSCRFHKEARAPRTAPGSALPVFATAIFGGPLPQSLLPYFQVFECCSQTTAVLLKAEPGQATNLCSLPTSCSWGSDPSPSPFISSRPIQVLHRACTLYLPRPRVPA